MHQTRALYNISLRDWFAGLAMQGIWTSPLAREEQLKEVAALSYALADAMLAERAKNEESPDPNGLEAQLAKNRRSK